MHETSIYPGTACTQTSGLHMDTRRESVSKGDEINVTDTVGDTGIGLNFHFA